MHPAGAPHGLAAWVYNNANKVFRLGSQIRVGGVVWGAGSIGPVSITTLARDLEKRFDYGHHAWGGGVPSAYTVEDVANKVREFFYTEKYLPAYPAPSSVPPA